MKKYLVLYYSKTGNSEFIAKRIAQKLGGDLKKLTPIVDRIAILLLLSLFKFTIRVGISAKELARYDEVVIVGPIWAGQLILPLRSAIKKCVKARRNTHLALSCETSDEEKNDKYGYAQVLQEAENVGEGLVKTTAAFSTALVRDLDEAVSLKLSEKTKITEENFKGVIKDRLEDFIARIRSSEKVVR